MRKQKNFQDFVKKNYIRFRVGERNTPNTILGIVALLILINLAVNLIWISRPIAKSLLLVMSQESPLKYSLEQRLRSKVGKVTYDYAVFISQHTPEFSKILIPPQAFPWPGVGNIGYFRYFVPRRILVNGLEKEPGLDLKKEDIDYVVISWGETGCSEYDCVPGWPKFFVPAKKIIYAEGLGEDNLVKQEAVYGDYRPDDVINHGAWGIIEVDKERL